jgi:nitrite reductase/ring-hydroxylating ferredoxin subunit
MATTEVEIRPLEGVPSDSGVPMRFLSKERYLSPEFHRQEVEGLWSRVWQMACREQDILNPGDFYEYRILDQSVLVVRQEDGSVKALHNACRHRGRPLGHGCGSASEFRCPYHAWTYNIDGSIKSIPSPEEFACGEDYGLAECAADRWGGFVFINLDPSPAPLLDYLSPAAAGLAPYHFESMVTSRQITNKFPCNWKSAIDPFIEAYHTVGSHPQLLLSLDDVNSTYELVGIHSRMTNPAFVASPRAGEVPEQAVWEEFIKEIRGIGLELADNLGELPEGEKAQDHVVNVFKQLAVGAGLDPEELGEDRMRNVNCWMLFPNLCLQTFATENFLWRARPTGPGTCELDQIILHPVPAGTEQHRAPAFEVYEHFRDYDCGLTLSQDFSNLMEVHPGMQQRGFEGTYCAVEQEKRIVHMHDVIDQFIAGKKLDEMT